MKLLPSENLVYVTRLSREEIINRLVKTPKFKAIDKGIGYDTFNLRRVVNYRNLYLLPQIKGKIQEQSRNSRVMVEMKLPVVVGVFIIIWFGFLGVCTVLSFVVALTEDAGSFDYMYIPIVMIIFGVALFYGIFKFESSKSKKELAQMLEAEV